MEDKKIDRRIRRTKALLLEGFTKLMMEKDINQISVKELADYADINRGTFYLHYKDVYDMLSKVEGELFVEFKEILDEKMSCGADAEPIDVLAGIFTLLYHNKEIVTAMTGPHGDLSFVSQLKELVKERLQYYWGQKKFKEDNFEYYYSFVVSGFIGLLDVWIAKGFNKTPLEMAGMYEWIAISGMEVLSGK